MNGSKKLSSNGYQKLYLIQLPNGYYSFLYTDDKGNSLSNDNDNEEIHDGINDLEVFITQNLKKNYYLLRELRCRRRKNQFQFFWSKSFFS
jgi:hypothetical protein